MSNDSSSKPEGVLEAAASSSEASSTPSANSTIRWHPLVAVVYAIFVFFAAQIIAGLCIVLYPHLRGWSSAEGTAWITHSIVGQFWFILLAESLTFGAIWWFMRTRRTSLRTLGWRWPRFWDPIVALAGFGVYFVTFVGIAYVSTNVLGIVDANQKQELGFANPTGTFNLLIVFISLCVLPPIVEELVFRGFLFTSLRSRMTPLAAGLITSTLFAVAHLQPGNGKPLLWIAALDTFVLSLVLCYLRQKTDSLWPGIFLHALKNSVAFIGLFLLASH